MVRQLKIKTNKVEFTTWQKDTITKVTKHFDVYFRLKDVIKKINFYPFTYRAGNSSYYGWFEDKREDLLIWNINIAINVDKGEFKKILIHELLHGIVDMLKQSKKYEKLVRKWLMREHVYGERIVEFSTRALLDNYRKFREKRQFH